MGVKFGLQNLMEQAPGLSGRAGCLRGFDQKGELLRGGDSLSHPITWPADCLEGLHKV